MILGTNEHRTHEYAESARCTLDHIARKLDPDLFDGYVNHRAQNVRVTGDIYPEPRARDLAILWDFDPGARPTAHVRVYDLHDIDGEQWGEVVAYYGTHKVTLPLAQETVDALTTFARGLTGTGKQ